MEIHKINLEYINQERAKLRAWYHLTKLNKKCKIKKGMVGVNFFEYIEYNIGSNFEYLVSKWTITDRHEWLDPKYIPLYKWPWLKN